MKESKKLPELTLEELIKKKNQIKGAAMGLGIVMVIAVIALVVLAMRTENYALITISLGGAVAFLPIFISLSQINTEIKSRSNI